MGEGVDEFGGTRVERIAMADAELDRARSIGMKWKLSCGFPTREIENDYVGSLNSAAVFYAINEMGLMARRVAAIRRAGDVRAAWQRFDDLNARS